MKSYTSCLELASVDLNELFQNAEDINTTVFTGWVVLGITGKLTSTYKTSGAPREQNNMTDSTFTMAGNRFIYSPQSNATGWWVTDAPFGPCYFILCIFLSWVHDIMHINHCNQTEIITGQTNKPHCVLSLKKKKLLQNLACVQRLTPNVCYSVSIISVLLCPVSW